MSSGSVISGERFGEGARTQFGQQTGVLAVGATNRQIWVLTHTIYPHNNEDAERPASYAAQALTR